MKIISKILVVAMIFSVMSSVCGFAADYVKTDIINAVAEEKIWTSGRFDPAKEITGAQLADMMNIALGITNAAEFIPAYSDGKAVTRAELAIAADKAGFAKVKGYGNRKYYRDIYTDTDALSDAEFQSVSNAVFYGTVIALSGKKFAPEQNATCFEAAKAVLTLKSMAKEFGAYSVKDVESFDAKKFDVYQKGILRTHTGIAGFGIVARFDGAPGDIYVARTTEQPLLEAQLGNAAAPVSLVRVIDPDGNIVARVNLDYVKSGKMEKIISVTEGKPGIYQISFTNGRDGDLCEIAISGAKSWGVRGEHSFTFTETTPKTSYVYIPKMAKHFSLATGGPDDKLTVTASNGEKFDLTYAMRESTMQAIEIEAPIVDSVYEIKTTDDFRNYFEIRGVSQLLSPTEEMAMDLKGGFVEVEDEYASWMLAGPLQARARAKMVEIYEKALGNFDVTVDMPYADLPAFEDIDNPIAEAQLYSTYYASLPALDTMLRSQCLEPANPYFGMLVGFKMVRGESAYPTNTFLSEYYNINMFGSTTNVFTGALSLNSQLNGFYDDPQLRDRVALAQLSCVMNMTQDGDIIDSGDPAKDAGDYYLTYTNFKFPDWANAYYSVRKMLDIETREICDTALMTVADKQVAMRGQGPTNQSAMNFYGTMAMYEATGDEAYHEFFKRQVDVYMYPNARPAYQGQAEPGYYLEAGGCDGHSYQLHNEDFFSRAMLAYFDLPTEMQDPATVAKLKAASERNLNFMDKWETGWVDGLEPVYATNFASRTRSGLGGNSAYIANNFLINHMPQARAIWSNDQTGTAIILTSAAYANSHEKAYEHLKKLYPKYDKYYIDTRNVGNSLMYEEMHEPLAENVTLPYQTEGDYNVWDQPGLVALKHKGIYMVSFYDNKIPKTISAVSPKVWQGGAPTFTWIDGLGYATSSDKPVNYNALPGNMMQIKSAINYKPYWKEEEFIHGAIVGTDADGNVFASGKERSELTWIEEGKKFEIGGVTPIEGKEISWIYDLTDEGVEITAGIDSISGKEEFWMQIPVVDQSVKNAEFKVTHENGKLVSEYKGKKMIIKWDASLEYKMNDHQPENKVRTQVLKIKLPADSCKATIKIVAE
ncbi:MAG: hypothetical protein IKW02_03205 [Clostridia bacterium]|nr:hypothetical protein [Clostridia bacterium]